MVRGQSHLIEHHYYQWSYHMTSMITSINSVFKNKFRSAFFTFTWCFAFSGETKIERVLTKSRNDLKRPTTSKKQPETTYNKQETIWNDLQQARNDLKRSTTSKTKKKKKDAKRPTKSRFSDYFTIWAKWFSSLTRFPLNIWLQSFEHCFTENEGERRVSSIYHHASSVNYHVYFLQDTRFIFSIWVSSQQGKGEAIILAPLFHFYPLCKSFGL